MYFRYFLIFFLIISFLITGCNNSDISSNNTDDKEDFSEVFQEVVVRGDSMEPTLYDGQRVNVSVGIKARESFTRGDLVLIKFRNDKKPFVKRLIALPGDKVIFDKKNIILNDHVLEEPYLAGLEQDDYSDMGVVAKQLSAYDDMIPPRSFFVLGDNRAQSFDSKEFGLVSYEHIIGKVLL